MPVTAQQQSNTVADDPAPTIKTLAMATPPPFSGATVAVPRVNRTQLRIRRRRGGGGVETSMTSGSSGQGWPHRCGPQLRVGPFSTGRSYISFQTADEDGQRIRAAYDANFERLTKAKKPTTRTTPSARTATSHPRPDAAEQPVGAEPHDPPRLPSPDGEPRDPASRLPRRVQLAHRRRPAARYRGREG